MTQIIIQARTSSRRLPGKVLLPINGIPMAILVAQRAANTGRPVLIASSSDPSDDLLCTYAGDYGIPTFRGPLEDVLGRFSAIVADLADDTPVVRLTADNPVPDGALIDELVDHFIREGLVYVRTNGEGSGLPYGISLEVTRAALLKQADSAARSRFDREHVTSWIRSQGNDSLYTRYAQKNLSAQSATVDTISDYLKVAKLFRSCDDPVQTSWIELIESLGKIETERPAIPALVLGGAQLGMAYGVTNEEPFCEKRSLELLTCAIENGINCVDTARDYGQSEKIIGRLRQDGLSKDVEVVTKLSALDATIVLDAIGPLVENSVLRSKLNLGVERLGTLLLHRAKHLETGDGIVWKQLLKLKKDGEIARLGVSVQNPDELRKALLFEDVEHLQIPANLLDYRWEKVLDDLREARSARKIIVHIRSSLLQGLLTSKDATLWGRAHVNDAEPILRWLREMQEQTERSSVIDLCCTWARSQDWADAVVVGSASQSQLLETIALFNTSSLSDEHLKLIRSTRPGVPSQTLDPAKWKRPFT
ncbi:aldo/keto reductase [Roseibium album]|uniref:aldo/keto reductase n=1 Tax=Roseibium album TaxID=311410 RepID=UPI00248FD5F8|nr:aldo/keto reductase [Roseibium album]